MEMKWKVKRTTRNERKKAKPEREPPERGLTTVLGRLTPVSRGRRTDCPGQGDDRSRNDGCVLHLHY
jgi:hypothetical protein